MAPERHDRRFAAAAWHDNAFLHRLMQTYRVDRDAPHGSSTRQLDDKNRVEPGRAKGKVVVTMR